MGRTVSAWKVIMVMCAICLGLALQSAARGDGVMMEPPPTAPVAADDAQYPDSRFGFAPSPVRPGIGPTYAAKATQEMDEEDVDLPSPSGANRGGGRRPAGLEYSQDTRPVRENPFQPSNEFNRENRGTPENPVAGAMENPMIHKGVQEVAIIAGDLGFFPKTVFVVRDLPVRMYVTGASRNTLCIMMDSFQVRKQVRSQKIEEITFTPASPGKYRFYCPVNGMEGTLVVKELTGPGSSSTAENAPLGRTTASETRAHAPSSGYGNFSSTGE